MNLTFLGTSPGLTEKDRYHSSIWIENDKSDILIDCGEGTSQSILKYKCNISKLDSVIITHYHPDHVSGLFMLIQNLSILGRRRELKLFLPERVDEFAEILSFFYLFEKRLGFKLVYKDLSDVNFHYQWIRSVENNHLKYLKEYVQKNKLKNRNRSYSIILEDESRNVFISSDISNLDIVREFKDSTTMVLDGYHPPAEEIIEMSKFRVKRKLDKIVLTHGLSKELLTINNSKITEVFELAEDGKKIDI